MFSFTTTLGPPMQRGEWILTRSCGSASGGRWQGEGRVAGGVVGGRWGRGVWWGQGEGGVGGWGRLVRFVVT